MYSGLVISSVSLVSSIVKNRGDRVTQSSRYPPSRSPSSRSRYTSAADCPLPITAIDPARRSASRFGR